MLPFFHSYGMSTTLVGGAMLGATTILHHRFNTKQVLRLIQKASSDGDACRPGDAVGDERATGSKSPVDLDSLKWVISGGAPLDESIANSFRRPFRCPSR